MTEPLAIPLAGPINSRPATQVSLLGPGSPLLREPTVLTDAWRLMTEVWKWTPAFLRETVGAETLLATLPGPDGKFRYEPGQALDSRPLPVAQFFDDVADKNGPSWCLQQVPLQRALPALAARLDYPSCVPRDLISAVNLWLAAPSTVTPLHYDDTHNLFAQVSGSKTFYMFPPENLDALYPGPINSGAQHLSRVDIFRPDFDRYPLAAALSYRMAVVHSGEALVLPAFWWHQVVSNDVSVSVNFWWRPHVADCLCPGFMRQLQSAQVQHDLSALTHRFVIGKGDRPDPVNDAVGLAKVLCDIGEYRAAIALSIAILHSIQGNYTGNTRARDLVAKCAHLAESQSQSQSQSHGGIHGRAGATRLISELEMLISSGIS
jgi:Cupin-like domain